MFSVPENHHHAATPATKEGGDRVRETGKGGRPILPDSERRVHRIGVNVNEAERAIIEARAEVVGLSVSVYLRQAGVGAKLSARVNDRSITGSATSASTSTRWLVWRTRPGGCRSWRSYKPYSPRS